MKGKKTHEALMLVAISWQRQIRRTHATHYDGVRMPSTENGAVCQAQISKHVRAVFWS